MLFSFAAFSATVGAVIVSGAVSLAEGTATNRRVTMGFINHGGMWGDLIIMSMVTGIVFPHLVRSYFLSAVFVALALTVIAHAQWAKGMRNDATTGHMFPTHKTGKWYVDISAAGWTHVFVMTMLLTVTLMYAVSPAPTNIVVAISLLLTVHVFLGTVQPGWYCTGKLWTWRNFGPPLLEAALIWCIALLKIQFAQGRF
jgi:hypothetical protein